MPKIKVNTDALRHKANDLMQCQDDQRQIINDVANLIEDIVSDWEGKAQEGFISAFENARPVYDQFQVDMAQFASYLEGFASTMEYLDIGGREDILRMTRDIPSSPSSSGRREHNGAWRMRDDG